MPYIAVLVESPAKCGKIEKFLGAGYKCMATFGHIRSLDNLNNIDIENNFKPTFTNVPNKFSQAPISGFDPIGLGRGFPPKQNAGALYHTSLTSTESMPAPMH